jgi:hypothetical protein
MKEFVLIYRVNRDPEFKPSAAQIQEMMTGWMNWMGGIAARDQLVDSGNRLAVTAAKSIGPGQVVSDGPYTEIKEFINGYTIIRAKSIDEAVEIAKDCPILQGGGKVEVRGVVTAEDFAG